MHRQGEKSKSSMFSDDRNGIQKSSNLSALDPKQTPNRGFIAYQSKHVQKIMNPSKQVKELTNDTDACGNS